MNLDLKLTEVIKNVQTGDETSFGALRTQYVGLLQSLVAQIASKLPEAEFDDLMQEATLAFYHAAMRFDTAQEEVTFGLFAKICVRNRLISVARRLNKSKFNARKTPSAEAMSTPGERRAARRVAYRELDAIAFQVLSCFEYSVFQLYLEGCSANEIAVQLEKSPKSIDNAIYRMRKKIKAQCDQSSLPSSD